MYDYKLCHYSSIVSTGEVRLVVGTRPLCVWVNVDASV